MRIFWRAKLKESRSPPADFQDSKESPSSPSTAASPLLEYDQVSGVRFGLSDSAVAQLEQVKASLGNVPLEQRLDEATILRFLRAREFNVDKSVKMLEKDLQWRVEMKVDSIAQTKMNYSDHIREHYPRGYHGVDRNGRPIFIDCIGKANVAAVLKKITIDELMAFYIQEYEHLVEVVFPCCSERAGRHIDRTTTIVDLAGLGWTHFNGDTRCAFKRLSALSQNHYPETLGEMFVINAPTVFSPMWSLITKFLDEETVKKIHICSGRGTSWKTKLAEVVDLEQLPDFLGGAYQGDDWTKSSFGPWVNPQILTRVLSQRRGAKPVLLSMGQDNCDGLEVDSDSAAEPENVPWLEDFEGSNKTAAAKMSNVTLYDRVDNCC